MRRSHEDGRWCVRAREGGLDVMIARWVIDLWVWSESKLEQTMRDDAERETRCA